MAETSEVKVQAGVYAVEVGRGRRAVLWTLTVLVALGLSMVYTALQFRGLERAEAMDMAQLARNIAHGNGFTTYVIRPLSLWQMKEFAPGHEAQLMHHPDLYNPPLYPLLLAGIFSLLPDSVFEFGSTDRVYTPERWIILPLNQVLLLLTLLLVYFWARALFDPAVAVTAGLILLFSNTLWGFSISGLPTNLLMLLSLLTVGALWKLDRRLNPVTDEPAAAARRMGPLEIGLLLGSAVLAGLCFLTRYTAGLLVVPLLFYIWRIVGGRRGWGWAAVYAVVFVAVISPWLVRNYNISGSPFGIAPFQMFGGESLQRNYSPNTATLYAPKTMARELVTGTNHHLTESLRNIGSDWLICFFVVGVMYAFRRRDIARLRGALLGLLAAGIISMSVFGAPGYRSGFDLIGGDLLVLFLPLIAVFGVAFFHLLLDRIPFTNRLTRAGAIGLFALVNVSPMIYTMLPPRRGLFPYPPYIAPVTARVAKWFGPQEVGASDLPWAMAWVGNRRTVWLPLDIKSYEDIHYFVAPKISFLLFTPYMLDRQYQSELLKGEFKEWSSILRGQLPAEFPLKYPLGAISEQLLLADRPRWSEQEAAMPVAPVKPKDKEEPGKQPAGAPPRPRIE